MFRWNNRSRLGPRGGVKGVLYQRSTAVSIHIVKLYVYYSSFAIHRIVISLVCLVLLTKWWLIIKVYELLLITFMVYFSHLVINRKSQSYKKNRSFREVLGNYNKTVKKSFQFYFTCNCTLVFTFKAIMSAISHTYETIFTLVIMLVWTHPSNIIVI